MPLGQSHPHCNSISIRSTTHSLLFYPHTTLTIHTTDPKTRPLAYQDKRVIAAYGNIHHHPQLSRSPLRLRCALTYLFDPRPVSCLLYIARVRLWVELWGEGNWRVLRTSSFACTSKAKSATLTIPSRGIFSRTPIWRRVRIADVSEYYIYEICHPSSLLPSTLLSKFQTLWIRHGIGHRI